ncbi:MAG: type II toxin-antitoxin system VapC family toxin [bacterium]|nr:type II toxin-antitoxin system VapC family toxin [bacterium]MDE0287600.1 type II toxin-antitoxin system VapC family toxin [bacterium]MDE0440226.1 type II toxin-antitoxin system VapC family toxin [bacterium]
MIVLDTNVISEVMRVDPDPEVLAWLDRQPPSSLFTTAISEAEIRAGIGFLDSGRRKRGLIAAADRAFYILFSGRVLPFDSRAAPTYADIAADRRAVGRPISQADCQIAAITRSRGASVASRDTGGFAHCGVEVIDPWSPT